MAFSAQRYRPVIARAFESSLKYDRWENGRETRHGISRWIHHNYKGAFPANPGLKNNRGLPRKEAVLVASEEVSREHIARTELTIWTASHVPTSTYIVKRVCSQSESIHKRNDSLISCFDVPPDFIEPPSNCFRYKAGIIRSGVFGKFDRKRSRKKQAKKKTAARLRGE